MCERHWEIARQRRETRRARDGAETRGRRWSKATEGNLFSPYCQMRCQKIEQHTRRRALLVHCHHGTGHLKPDEIGIRTNTRRRWIHVRRKEEQRQWSLTLWNPPDSSETVSSTASCRQEFELIVFGRSFNWLRRNISGQTSLDHDHHLTDFLDWLEFLCTTYVSPPLHLPHLRVFRFRDIDLGRGGLCSNLNEQQ